MIQNLQEIGAIAAVDERKAIVVGSNDQPIRASQAKAIPDRVQLGIWQIGGVEDIRTLGQITVAGI